MRVTVSTTETEEIFLLVYKISHFTLYWQQVCFYQNVSSVVFFLVFFLPTLIFIVLLVTAVLKLHIKFVLVCRRATVSMIPTNLQLKNLFSCYLEILNSKSLSTVYRAQQGFILTCTCIYELYEIIEIWRTCTNQQKIIFQLSIVMDTINWVFVPLFF